MFPSHDPGEEWKMQNGEGNINLVSIQDGDSCEGDFDGGYFDDGGNIFVDYSALSESVPLFNPYIWSFEYPLTKAEFDTIRNNKNKSIEVETFDGVMKEMFILSLEYRATEPLGIFECIEANV